MNKLRNTITSANIMASNTNELDIQNLNSSSS